MKKGYIFSWFNSGRNYGQTLQAYALQRVLRDMNYDVSHVCFDTNRYVKTTFLDKLRDFKNLTPNQRIIQRKFDDFISSEMKITPDLPDKKFVQKYIKENRPDFLICGSDQVWNPYYVHPFYFLAELDVEGINRIAYAVSTCDKRRIDMFSERPEIEKWIKQIDYVYVRENSGKEILKDLYGIDSKVVLDPTLLLSGDEWIKKLKLKKKDSNYILCYAFNLTESQKKMIADRATEKNCKVVYADMFDKNVNANEMWSPTDFLEAILNAKEIYTDSFHGTVFSILFHKEFTIFDNGHDIDSDPYYNIDRMNTLLTLVGLEERIFKKSNIYTEKTIDYSLIDTIFSKKRKECISMLRRSIG